MPPTTSPLSPAGKLLVLLDFLSRDRIITYNNQALLKDMVLANDPEVMALVPLLAKEEEEKRGGGRGKKGEEDEDRGTFVEELYKVIDKKAEETFNDIFRDCTIDVAKSNSKTER